MFQLRFNCVLFSFYFQYLFVDKHSKIIYRSTDDCLSFAYVYVTFIPDEISFHPSNSEVVLAYDETTEKVKFISSASLSELSKFQPNSCHIGLRPCNIQNSYFL